MTVSQWSESLSIRMKKIYPKYISDIRKSFERDILKERVQWYTHENLRLAQAGLSIQTTACQKMQQHDDITTIN